MSSVSTHQKNTSILQYKFANPWLAGAVVVFYLIFLTPGVAALVSNVGLSPWPMVIFAVCGFMIGYLIRAISPLHLKRTKSVLDLVWNICSLGTVGSLFYSALTMGSEDLRTYISAQPPFLFVLFCLFFFGTGCLRVAISLVEMKNIFSE